MTKINDIYWLAGLLDGEGYFGYQSTPHINISQVDLDLVEKAKLIFGECPPIKHYKSKNENHKDHYTLTVNGMLAVQWMMTLYPLMSLRRKGQIREVLFQWKNSKRRSADSDYCSNGHPLLVENIDYYAQKTSTDSITKVCKICKNESQNKRYNENLEESRNKQRIYWNSQQRKESKLAKMLSEHEGITLEQAKEKIKKSLENKQ